MLPPKQSYQSISMFCISHWLHQCCMADRGRPDCECSTEKAICLLTGVDHRYTKSISVGLLFVYFSSHHMFSLLPNTHLIKYNIFICQQVSDIDAKLIHRALLLFPQTW